MRIVFFALVVGFVGGCLTTSSGTTLQPPSEESQLSVLGASDVLEIRVYGEPELSGAHQVSPDGSVRMPLIGDVPVKGKTPDEVQSAIETAYNDQFLKNAQVTVLVKKYNSRRIYVLGQVKNPGNYDFEERMTVIAAIAKAGGTTRLSDANRTVVSRGRGTDQERMTVNVSDIQRGNANDVELIPGDIVYVPESLF